MTEEEKKIQTQEGVVRLKEKLIELCKNDGIKFESKRFYEVQTCLIAGFLAATNEVPVEIGIAQMSRRPLVEPYKL